MPIKEQAKMLTGNRRILLDMHIPDWETSFLQDFEPLELAQNYSLAKVDSAMIYTQSHVGLCYWPTKVGKAHLAVKNRDWVQEMTDALSTENIEVVGYYSIIFNNQAFLDHKEWRIEPRPKMSGGAFHGERYGHVCPNNSDYLAFVSAQLNDLLGSHKFDGFFIDMTFWPGICRCDACSTKFKIATGKDIPTEINWNNSDWCRFQSEREKWINDFASFINHRIKKNNPQMPVYHNFAVGLFNWRWGVNFDFSEHNDFLGGDFYGSPDDQFLMSRLMLNLSKKLPFEFMTSRCIHLTDHVENKPEEQLLIQAFASLATNAAFRIIDAVNPTGKMNTEFYKVMGRINKKLAKYPITSTVTPVEDVAVYISDSSKMNFNENGTLLTNDSNRFNLCPHLVAAKGAVNALKETQTPVGVITKKQLAELANYKIVVLPNITRMEQQEIDAFKQYVANGGCIYASGLTSLTTTDGIQQTNFLLKDVFGVSFVKMVEGKTVYTKLVDNNLKKLFPSQAYLTQLGQPSGVGNSVEVAALPTTKIKATLTLPYAYPKEGSVFETDWSSIHSSPPFKDTNQPVITENAYKKGKSVYVGTDIESSNLPSHKKLFKQLIIDLLPDNQTFSADAHPDVWMTAFHCVEEKYYLLNFLNFAENLPAITHNKIRFYFNNKPGKKFIELKEVPTNEPISFKLDKTGTLLATLKELRHFVQLKIVYLSMSV